MIGPEKLVFVEEQASYWADSAQDSTGKLRESSPSELEFGRLKFWCHPFTPVQYREILAVSMLDVLTLVL